MKSTYLLVKTNHMQEVAQGGFTLDKIETALYYFIEALNCVGILSFYDGINKSPTYLAIRMIADPNVRVGSTPDILKQIKNAAGISEGDNDFVKMMNKIVETIQQEDKNDGYKFIDIFELQYGNRDICPTCKLNNSNSTSRYMNYVNFDDKLKSLEEQIMQLSSFSELCSDCAKYHVCRRPLLKCGRALFVKYNNQKVKININLSDTAKFTLVSTLTLNKSDKFELFRKNGNKWTHAIGLNVEQVDESRVRDHRPQWAFYSQLK